ncbi:MAG TPA: hypothetical protein VNF70_08515 [Pyrinomonadaceae bacterium]|nr:hypothetical protein [Pyrinomonadaceae bacterium]
MATLLVVASFCGLATTTQGALHFLKSDPQHFDFVDQRALPPAFGGGEFTFEFWIKPDDSFPVGFTDRGTLNQLSAWSNADIAPYSSGNWWFAGNFLLDGHTRPDGFTPDKTREGTFSLQFYGGGRLRWMFADDGDVAPLGKVWAVEAYPANSTTTLLDRKWHNVNCVRRWVGTTKAQLELWIDGKLVGKQIIPMRVNMRQFWDHLPHPRNPAFVGGWCWGSEVMTAWNYYFTQYEDYKGLLAEIRFWDRAKRSEEIETNWMRRVSGKEPGLVGYFPLDENTGTVARDRLDPSQIVTLHNSQTESWSTERPFDREQ